MNSPRIALVGQPVRVDQPHVVIIWASGMSRRNSLSIDMELLRSGTVVLIVPARRRHCNGKQAGRQGNRDRGSARSAFRHPARARAASEVATSGSSSRCGTRGLLHEPVGALPSASVRRPAPPPSGPCPGASATLAAGEPAAPGQSSCSNSNRPPRGCVRGRQRTCRDGPSQRKFASSQDRAARRADRPPARRRAAGNATRPRSCCRRRVAVPARTVLTRQARLVAHRVVVDEEEAAVVEGSVPAGGSSL